MLPLRRKKVGLHQGDQLERREPAKKLACTRETTRETDQGDQHQRDQRHALRVLSHHDEVAGDIGSG